MPDDDAIIGVRRPILAAAALPSAFDYRAPADWPAGTIVEAPLGQRRVFGALWDGEAAGDVDDARLRAVIRAVDAPPLPVELRRTIDWTAAYTLSPPGAVLKLTLGAAGDFAPTQPRRAYRRAAHDGSGRMTPARRAVLAALDGRPSDAPMTASALAAAAGVGAAVVTGLAKAGWLEAVDAPTAAADRRLDPHAPGPALSPAQAAAATALNAALRGEAGVTLLDGVTGAGKTETYLEAVAACLAAGRQALVLLPEIALTTALLNRFAARFGAAPTPWHSELPGAARRRIWRAAAEGAAQLVVGARSALFLPFAALGLIIVDEEHDPSFKQDDGVVYHARDIAVVRGRCAGAAVILASATPSLESWDNAQRGRYRLLRLPDRYGGARKPDIAAVDLRQDRPARGRFVSETLRAATAETLARGEQALWFLNRRGYAPLTLCRSCGARLDCRRCDAWLVEHRLAERLRCHLCGYSAPRPTICPQCGAEDALHAVGPGVERLTEEATVLFPQARIETVSSDLLRGPGAAAAFAERMRRRTIDLVIGTQIAAKGHDFSGLTLVGIVDADLGLRGGDLRAAERSFQLLEQAAGRAGRAADRPGRALLQTTAPDHSVMAALAAGERDGFLAAESAARRAAGMPPFGRLAAIVISAPSEATADAAARAYAATAPQGPGAAVYGPAPAPIAVLRGRHRRRLLLRTDRGVDAQALLRAWRAAARTPRAAIVKIDVDPQSFL